MVTDENSSVGSKSRFGSTTSKASINYDIHLFPNIPVDPM